jgi:hypothetical protein
LLLTQLLPKNILAYGAGNPHVAANALPATRAKRRFDQT